MTKNALHKAFIQYSNAFFGSPAAGLLAAWMEQAEKTIYSTRLKMLDEGVNSLSGKPLRLSKLGNPREVLEDLVQLRALAQKCQGPFE